MSSNYKIQLKDAIFMKPHTLCNEYMPIQIILHFSFYSSLIQYMQAAASTPPSLSLHTNTTHPLPLSLHFLFIEVESILGFFFGNSIKILAIFLP